MNKEYILITGVDGLLGSNLADWIIENKPNYGVIGVDSLFGGYLENINEKVIIVVTLLTNENTNNIIPKIKSVILNPFFVPPYLLSINIIIK